jgi:hypothetical protein
MLNSQILSGLGAEFPHAEFALGPEVVNLSNLTTYTFNLTLPRPHMAADMYMVLVHTKASTGIYPSTETFGGLSVSKLGWPGINNGTVFLVASRHLRLYAPDTTTLTYTITWAVTGCTGMSARIVGLYNTGCSLATEWLAMPTPAGYSSIPGLGTGGLGGTSTAFRLRAGEQLLLSSNAPASSSVHTWAVTGASYGAVPITYAVQRVFESGVGYLTQALVTIPADDNYTLSLTRASGTDYFMGRPLWITSGRAG